MQSIFDRLGDTMFSLAKAPAHHSYPTVFEGTAHIGKVEIDIPFHGDQFGDTLCGYGQCLVGLFKTIEPRQIRVDLTQVFIVDDQKRIDILA